jgi:hypothetical protein
MQLIEVYHVCIYDHEYSFGISGDKNDESFHCQPFASNDVVNPSFTEVVLWKVSMMV